MALTRDNGQVIVYLPHILSRIPFVGSQVLADLHAFHALALKAAGSLLYRCISRKTADRIEHVHTGTMLHPFNTGEEPSQSAYPSAIPLGMNAGTTMGIPMSMYGTGESK